MTDEEIIWDVIKREGGATFTDNPADKGGPTKFGITLATLSSWRHMGLTADDVRNLTEGEARAIYRMRYIEAPRFNLLADETMRAVVVDAGVNHGPANATRMLQRALGVKDDGVIGVATLTAANATPGKQLALRLLAERTRFFGRMISKNLTDADHDGIPDNAEFASGWLNRVADQIDMVAA